MKEKEQITLRLPADVKEVIKNEARKRGISFNTLILTILDDFIQDYQANGQCLFE